MLRLGPCFVSCALAAVAGAVAVTNDACSSTPFDPPQYVRNGHDYKSYNSSSLTAQDCLDLCCKDSECQALSYNNPQPGGHDYLTCTGGGVCCLLKNEVAPLTNNTYGPNVRTAAPQKPQLPPPTPSKIQQRFMEMSFSQFMHFSVTTFGNEEHDCYKGKCLPASDFAPTDVDTDQWVQTAVAGGAGEICLTAHHEGGFALWPTKNDYNYTVAFSPWGKDILRPFVESCKKYGVRICYYISPSANGYLTQAAKLNATEFVKLQLAMIEEVLVDYGPVSRLWFDHYGSSCGGLSNCPGGFPEAWPEFIDMIRRVSPDTVIGTGIDVGHSKGGESGVGSYPIFNACNISSEDATGKCGDYGIYGNKFMPREADATIQNPGDAWFWHPGHAFWNASEIWDHYFLTWGRGDAFILNMPPNTTGVIPAEYANALALFGQANRASFNSPVASASAGQLKPMPCDGSDAATVELQLPSGSESGFNAGRLEESLAESGQRIVSYAVEGLPTTGGGDWEALPYVHGMSVGYRVVDFYDGSGPDAAEFSESGEVYRGTGTGTGTGTQGSAGVGPYSKVRFRCLAARTEPVQLSWFGVYNATGPRA